MSPTYLLTVFLLFIAPAMAQGQLVVVVEGLRSTNGTVMVGLFDNDKSFPRKAVVGKIVPVKSTTVTAEFSDLPPGRYAISIIHDENGNNELDTNGIGIPKEGFGFGNNAMGMFGPPSFARASVIIGKARVRQALRMRYF